MFTWKKDSTLSLLGTVRILVKSQKQEKRRQEVKRRRKEKRRQ